MRSLVLMGLMLMVMRDWIGAVMSCVVILERMMDMGMCTWLLVDWLQHIQVEHALLMYSPEFATWLSSVQALKVEHFQLQVPQSASEQLPLLLAASTVPNHAVVKILFPSLESSTHQPTDPPFPSSFPPQAVPTSQASLRAATSTTQVLGPPLLHSPHLSLTADRKQA